MSCGYHLHTDNLLWRNFLVYNVEIAHVTLTTPTQGTLTHHKTKTSHDRPCTKFEVSSVSRCGDITWGVKF